MKTVRELEQELHRGVMRCSIEARGLWYVMRHVIDHESERPGHLQDGARPVFTDQLAHCAGCTAERVSHWLGELSAAGVVETNDAGVLFSPFLARISGVRSSSQSRAARSRANRGGGGALRSALRAPDVAPLVAPLVRAGPPPPASLPPYTPIPSPPAPLWASGEAVASASDARAAKGGRGGRPGTGGTVEVKRRKGKRVRTDEEHATWREFRRWFCAECWPKYHGGVAYDFDAEDKPQKRAINYEALWRFLDHDAIAFDVEKARKTAEYFAQFCADYHPQWDVPLQRLAKKAEQYWQKSQLPRSNRVIGPNAIRADESRGLYASEFPNLRVSGGAAG